MHGGMRRKQRLIRKTQISILSTKILDVNSLYAKRQLVEAGIVHKQMMRLKYTMYRRYKRSGVDGIKHKDL